jgi:hypothetical protein
MMQYKDIFIRILFVIITFHLSSCKTNNKEVIKPLMVGSQIDLMEYAVIPIKNDSCTNFIKSRSQYKIVTYTNIYCEACWNNALLWKKNLKYFNEYPQVNFYCYVYATLDDFVLKNLEAKLDFPVFLDTRERFKRVNHLGNDPQKLTFLLNSDNKIILIGPPFTKEMRDKYLSVISNKN